MAPQHGGAGTRRQDGARGSPRRSARIWIASRGLRRYLDDPDIPESELVLTGTFRIRADARAERTNYLLTRVAAIFLPLGFPHRPLCSRGVYPRGWEEPLPGAGSSGGAIFAMQLVLF